MKKSIYVFGILFLMLFVSCNKDNNNQTAISEEAVITSFYLYSDSIKDISNYKFTIDNDSMLIYNYDSIAYGTEVDSLAFVLNPHFHKVYINDSIDFYALAGVYLDFTKEVKFTVVAADKIESADYRVRVNVHQVDPDTFIWKCVNDRVFEGDALTAKAVYVNELFVYLAVVGDKLVVNKSANGSSWLSVLPKDLDVDLAKLNLNNLVATDNCMYVEEDGRLYKSVDGTAWSVVDATGVEVDRLLFAMNDKVYAATISNHIARLDAGVWSDLGELPVGFPVEGGAVLVADAPSGKSRVFVVGGIDKEGNYLSSVWSSEDGVYWSEMTSGKKQFAPRAYAAVVQYGDGLMLFGGKDAAGKVVEDAQLFSKDYGMTWSEPKAKTVVDSLYVPRYEHSAVVTPSGYIYLIGGRTSAEAAINDVWMGLNYASLPGFRR